MRSRARFSRPVIPPKAVSACPRDLHSGCAPFRADVISEMRFRPFESPCGDCEWCWLVGFAEDEEATGFAAKVGDWQRVEWHSFSVLGAGPEDRLGACAADAHGATIPTGRSGASLSQPTPIPRSSGTRASSVTRPQLNRSPSHESDGHGPGVAPWTASPILQVCARQQTPHPLQGSPNAGFASFTSSPVRPRAGTPAHTSDSATAR